MIGQVNTFVHFFGAKIGIPTGVLDVVGHGLTIIVWVVYYYAIARLVLFLLIRAVRRLVNANAIRIDVRRRATMEALLDNVIRYTVWFVFAILVLSKLDPHIETLLAGAGIAGVAVAFGAQSLIKDVITGFFILFEDQYGVGDTVLINGITGTVRSVGLRLTRLQAWTGEEQIIPNGQIQQVTNYSRHNSKAIVDVSVGRDANLEQVYQVMAEVLNELANENSSVVGAPQLLGIQAITNQEVQLRALVDCLPNDHFVFERQARERLLQRFSALGNVLPMNQVVVHTGSAPTNLES